jgi:hypothetical protein
MDVGKCHQNGFLGGLFRVRFVIEDTHGGGEKSPFAGLDEPVESFLASRPRLLHEF